MNCPNCKNEMRETGMIFPDLNLTQIRCPRCYYWRPMKDSTARMKKEWKEDMQLEAEVFKLVGFCPWVTALKKDGFL